jgi:hypothetical protein
LLTITSVIYRSEKCCPPAARSLKSLNMSGNLGKALEAKCAADYEDLACSSSSAIDSSPIPRQSMCFNNSQDLRYIFRVQTSVTQASSCCPISLYPIHVRADIASSATLRPSARHLEPKPVSHESCNAQYPFVLKGALAEQLQRRASLDQQT